jgi:signal transduction histidine kinase/ActR/RegA family two-component response regulator
MLLLADHFTAFDGAIVVAVSVIVALVQLGMRAGRRHYLWLAASVSLTLFRLAIAPLDQPEISHLDFRHAAASVSGLLGFGAFWVGLLGHFGLPANARRWVTLAVMAPPVLSVVAAWSLVFSGGVVSRMWFVSWGYFSLLLISGIGFRAARSEPAVGHSGVALAGLFIPLAYLGAFVLGAWGALRPFVTMAPMLLFLLFVIRTNYLREQARLVREVTAREAGERALVNANERLEQRVIDRTCELSDALRKAEASNEARGRFLALISHEIRTPLNGLSGMLQILGTTPLSADQQDLLNTARVSSRQLRSLLDDSLDLAKMEAGRFQIEAVPFDIRAQIVECIEPFRQLAVERGLGFEVSLHTPQRWLHGDPNRIAQILRNLLDNALKFTPAGRISVEIGAQWVDPATGLCELSMAIGDTGVGIAPEQQALIFQSFKQADSSVARRFGGTGLGLALCRELCQHMGGEISVESEPGQGSRFLVVLPCALAPSAQTPARDAEAAASAQAAPASLAGRSVLVVDDNRINQKVLQRMLESAGMSVHLASSGESALDRVAVEAFDVVLMDVSMPGMDGLTATRAIRALGESGLVGQRRMLSLPIIGVSAMALAGDRESGIEAGMCDYLFKPIERQVLLATVARALEPS